MAAVRVKLLALATVGAVLAFFGSGALASAQTTTYSYDVFGRLSSVSTAGGAQTTYAYDAADNRSQLVKTSGVQVIGAVKHKTGRRWIQFALRAKRHLAPAKAPTALAAVATPLTVHRLPRGTPLLRASSS